MTQLQQLPEMAEQGLGGLKADARLLGQIRLAASARGGKKTIRFKPLLTVGFATALCLCIAFWALPKPQGNPGTPADLLGTHAAGGAQESLWVRAMDVTQGGGRVDGAATDVGTYRNLFAPEHNGNFPLMLINGAAYRMLISPTNMSADLLGESLGQVAEYTLEPALSTGGDIVSNIVSAQSDVYAVKNMRGALAAAYVKGGLRVFQRVSFAGTAILGDETLTDTLSQAKGILAMELTGSGIVDNPDTARQLMQVLLDNAVYESASVGSGGSRSLLLALDNGLLMQLMIGDDTVSACGTWSCPEFFEAYDRTVAAQTAS